MKEIVFTTNAPAPIGPYSQAVKVGGLVYVSGQIAIEPSSGELKMSSIAEETEMVLNNLGAVLKESGSDFNCIIKTSIFLSDMSLFVEVNALYAKRFASDFPARETVAVSGLPKGVNVEISAIATAD
ncbi:MAG: RidA family protein [Cryomorphaceae bacterium]|nr:RidA family protein [Cryomorphaceae bacterium]